MDTVDVRPDIVYAERHGIPTSFDVYRPPAPNGAAILFINSGGFVSGQLRQWAESGPSGYRFLSPEKLSVQGAEPPIPLLAQFSFAGLLNHGFTVFDIRHSNHPPAMLDEMVEDVHRAVRFLRKHAADYGVDPRRLGIWGASAGGYLALHAGLDFEDAPFRAIATYYPAGYDFAADLDQFPELADALPMMQLDSDTLDALGLRHRIRTDAPPVLIVFGADDMPFITGPCRALCAALRRESVSVRCIEIAGTGHEFRGEDGYHEQHGSHAQAELVAWFLQHLSA